MTARWLLASGLAALTAVATLSAQPRWRLTETLRIGGADTGAASFSRIISIEADAKGRVFAFDAITQDLRMFAPDGKPIRVIGRTGSGPGEFRRVQGVKIARDGKIWVRDHGNQRFSIFSADGDFQQNRLAYFCSYGVDWKGIVDRAGNIVDPDCVANAQRATGNVFKRYAPNAEAARRLRSSRGGRDGMSEMPGR